MLRDIGVLLAGFLIGIFGLCNILLPITYLLPKVVGQVRSGKADQSKIWKCFIAPVVWGGLIFGLYLLARKFQVGGIFLIGLSAGGSLALINVITGKSERDMEADVADILNEEKK